MDIDEKTLDKMYEDLKKNPIVKTIIKLFKENIWEKLR